MFWFLAAGAGLFYAFWKTTAPTESEYREALARAKADADAQVPEEPADQPEDSLRGDEEEAAEEQDVPLIEHANAESLGEKAYDPAKNPFKSVTRENSNGDGFPGSFDDIMPDDAPLEDYVEGGEEDDDADGI